MADLDNATPMRVCTECNSGKPATLEYFPPHKAGKYGLHSWCRPCKKAIDAARRNRPDQKARQKQWRRANAERVRVYNASYREAGYSSTEHVARWRAENLDHARANEARRNRERREADPSYRLLCRLRARLGAMATAKGGRRTQAVFPFTVAELRAHLERQFVGGMSWDNAGEWHIDHIVPVAAFRIESVEDPDFLRCWSLANLRPLWADDNRRKGAKIEVLL